MLFSRAFLFYMSALSPPRLPLPVALALISPAFRRINKDPPRLDAASMPNEMPALRCIRRRGLAARPARPRCQSGKRDLPGAAAGRVLGLLGRRSIPLRQGQRYRIGK